MLELAELGLVPWAVPELAETFLVAGQKEDALALIKQISKDGMKRSRCIHGNAPRRSAFMMKSVLVVAALSLTSLNAEVLPKKVTTGTTVGFRITDPSIATQSVILLSGVKDPVQRQLLFRPAMAVFALRGTGV